MADTTRAAFSFGNAAIFVSAGDNEFSDGRTSLYRSTGASAAAGHGAALVVQKPLPRLARAAALPGMHEIVSRAF
jgi:hypothetical protein